MKTTTWLAFGGLLLAMLQGGEATALDGWLRSRDDGLAAAEKSGRPVLVVTMWKEKV